MIINALGRPWHWNPLDKKLVQVNDWISDLYVAIKHVPAHRRGVAIQAGGAMGMWPYVMADEFDTVHTFEAEQENYRCLAANVKDRKNIRHYNAALGLYEGFARIMLPKSEHNNAGAFYTMPADEGVGGENKVPQFSIDTLVEEGEIEGRVDFIQLDVEGRELCVLAGAIETLTHDQPVIMLEDKPLPQDAHTGHKFGEVEKWLVEDMDYRVAERVHRDIIFVPKGA